MKRIQTLHACALLAIWLMLILCIAITSVSSAEKLVNEKDWTLILTGIQEKEVTKEYFEEGIACLDSGHKVEWTDENGTVWTGIPLWFFVGMIDDDEKGSHFTFSDALAEKNYSITVTASDGWDTTFNSADIARSDGYIIAYLMNGAPLDEKTEKGKPLWPLAMKGSKVFGGQSVGGITSIALSGLSSGSESWNLSLNGAVSDTYTPIDFTKLEEAGSSVVYTDAEGKVWTGIPLWYLTALIDDLATTSEPTLNKDLINLGYSINVKGTGGKTVTFSAPDIANSESYIIAYKVDGEPIAGEDAPLKLTGEGVEKSDALGGITSIDLSGLPEEEKGEWSLKMSGAISTVIYQPYFEEAATCHNASWKDEFGNEYTGIPLWRLLGWVDDRTPHGGDGFNEELIANGYTVIVKAGDGYAKEFLAADIGSSDEAYIIADKLNGTPLSKEGEHPVFPLKLVGTNVKGGSSVGNIESIELTNFGIQSQSNQSSSPGQTGTEQPKEALKPEIPKVRIVKYDEDDKTVINETTVDALWMEENLPVIGDGETEYKYEGTTNDPEDVWDENETFPGGFKIEKAVKGTAISDLVNLVGGMEPGTYLNLIASDGYQTKLGYSNIYPNPAIKARQGDAFLAWYADERMVPEFKEGYQLFFTGGEDQIFSLWDMHESMEPDMYHYYWSGGVQYASSAGLSAKYVSEIAVYSKQETDWTLDLDGSMIGGLETNISSGYFDEALVCQFGSEHKTSFADEQGQVWEGMPLWFLCGFVDDEDQHSSKAYNETLADTGYMIVITGSDGETTAIEGKDALRSGDYIIASIKDGVKISESDPAWPLQLTGAKVENQIQGVSKIELKPLE